MKKSILLLNLSLFLSTVIFAQTNVSGTISSDTTWSLINSPYTVTGSVGVSSGVTLTIEAGVIINFSGDYKILVKGSLISSGTSSSLITFNGNSVEGNEVMIMLKSTNLSNSTITYNKFTGPQKAIQLANESEHNQDSPKNSGILTVTYSDFNNAGLYTKGYSSSAELKFENSTFDDLIIKGYYPRSEPITFTNCTVNNSSIDSDAYNYGIKFITSTVKNSNITMGCCSANFLFNGSIVYNSNISNGMGSPVNGLFKVVNSFFISSSINLASSHFISEKSIFFSKNEASDMLSIGNTEISNSSFIGYNKSLLISGIKISGRAGYNIGGNTNISNSTLLNFNSGLVFDGKNTVSIANNNIISNSLYNVKNNTSFDLILENNYWGTSTESEIQNSLYDSNEDVDKGTIDYTPFSTTLNTTAPISPPSNVTKSVSGSDVVLSWTANGESDTEGYKLHYGSPTGYSYATTVDLGNVTTYTVTGGDIATEYAVTAYDSSLDGTDDMVDGNESWFTVANEVKVTLTSSASSISEPTNSVTLTATLDNTSSADVTVNLTYSGTATNATDYSGASSITVSAGLLTRTTAITAIDDTDVEVTETIVVDVDTVTGGSENGTQQASINLTDNDVPSVSSIVLDQATIAEDGGVSVITATISAVHSKNTTIPLTITGTATFDMDYSTAFASKGKASIYHGGNGLGSENNQLKQPEGLALDSDGNLYIADYRNNRIQKVTKSNGVVITLIDGLWGQPTDLHVDSNGNIYVLSNGENSSGIVKKYDNQGTFISNVSTGMWPNVISMHIGTNGDIYTISHDSKKVWKATSINTSASVLFEDDTFHFPNSIAVDSDGNVYVSGQNQPIRKWTKSTSISSNLDGTDSYGNPWGGSMGYGSRAITINSKGNIVVANDGSSLSDRGAKIVEYKLENGEANVATNLYTQDSSTDDYYMGISSIIEDNNGDLYIAIGKDASQSGSGFSDVNVKKDRILFIGNGFNITITAGSISGTFTINGIEDSISEGSETIIITPSNPVNGTLASLDATIITITDPLPELPTDIVIDTAPRKAKLAWTSSVSENISGYKIFRGLSENPTDLLTTVSSDDIFFIDNNLTEGTTYYYTIKTIDSNGLESLPSQNFVVTPTNTWYVATTGTASGFGSSSDPYSAIQTAIDGATDGDTVLVYSGTYVENINFNGKNIKVKSVSGANETIINPSNSSVPAVWFSNSETISANLDGFKISDGGNLRGSALKFQSHSNPIVENCIITNSGGEAAISFYYSGATLKNCLIFNNPSISVFFYDPGVNTNVPKIINCTITGNKGIGNNNQSYVPIYKNCIIWGQTVPENFGNIDITYSLLDSDFTGVGNINANPYFVDATNADYHLLNYSPSIGAGTATDAPTTDIDGNSRPNPSGTNPDMGAYENTLGVQANAPPVISLISDITVLEDADSQTVNLLGIDNGNLSSNQTISITSTSNNATLIDNPVINYIPNNTTGTLTFKPNLNKNGTAIITVRLIDTGGTDNSGIDSTLVTFNVNITPVNDAPVSATQIITSNEDEEVAITLAATDVESDPLSYVISVLPTNGTLYQTADGLTKGDAITSVPTTLTNTDHKLIFVPVLNESGNDYGNFSFKANDGTIDSNVSVITVNITPINDAPVANDQTILVDEQGTVSVLTSGETTLLYNASDAENDALTAVLVTEPSNGTLVLNSDGTFSYEQNGTETISDSFTYKANDGNLDSEIATVTITITPVNDNTPSDIVLSSNTINENLSDVVIGQFSAIDLDLPTDTHVFELVSGTGDDNNANFTISGTNLINATSFDYETQIEFSIRVKVTDENNASFEKVLNITVLNVNDINISFEKTGTDCSGNVGVGSITINSINETSGNLTFVWTASNGGVIPSEQSTNQNLTNLLPGTYNISISDSFFTYEESFEIDLIPQYDGLSICYVSSDETDTTKNRIFLNNEGNYNVAVYEILRESNVTDVFNSIGTIGSTSNSFLDDTSNNTAQAYTYKVRLIDNCDIISSDSDAHKTILLQSSIAVNNSVNLSWTHYLGTAYTTYNIYRKTTQNSFQQIGSVSSTNSTYNDQTADVSANNYEYYIAIGISDCNVQAKTTDLTEIKSNIQNITNGSLSINELNIFNSLSIYPNPTNSTLFIEGNETPIAVSVYNVLGQEVISIKNTNKIDVKALPSGVYIIRISDGIHQTNRKFVKN
jgi:VCBS repeat-containing protein